MSQINVHVINLMSNNEPARGREGRQIYNQSATHISCDISWDTNTILTHEIAHEIPTQHLMRYFDRHK